MKTGTMELYCKDCGIEVKVLRDGRCRSCCDKIYMSTPWKPELAEILNDIATERLESWQALEEIERKFEIRRKP